SHAPASWPTWRPTSELPDHGPAPDRGRCRRGEPLALYPADARTSVSRRPGPPSGEVVSRLPGRRAEKWRAAYPADERRSGEPPTRPTRGEVASRLPGPPSGVK